MPAAADNDEKQDHVAVLELGATGEREISERNSHIGPAVGIEIEPIENWLEIECGASTYRSGGATNWELELPFKKPFRLPSGIALRRLVISRKGQFRWRLPEGNPYILREEKRNIFESHYADLVFAMRLVEIHTKATALRRAGESDKLGTFPQWSGHHSDEN